jgi:hypothetical protein
MRKYVAPSLLCATRKHTANISNDIIIPMKAEIAQSSQPEKMACTNIPKKVTDAVARNYPGTEDLVSFSDDW